MASLAARAGLLAARGDWIGALADLDMALTNRPDDAVLKLKRGELLLQQGDWLRGLPDHEARLALPAERYAPELPRWQGEPLPGRLLVYPEQADIESDAVRRDTLMLARGLDAVDHAVQCDEPLAAWLDATTVRRGDSLEGFAAAAPLRSLPFLLGLEPTALPPPIRVRPKPEPGAAIGWFTHCTRPSNVVTEQDPAEIPICRLVVGDDCWPTHLAAALGVPTVMIVPRARDWLWGPSDRPAPQWYPRLELLQEGDDAGLAARLAAAGS
jgi:hypothetical protein